MRIPFQLSIAALVLMAGLLLSFADLKKMPADPLPAGPVETAWVDSVFNALTPDQRLGQFFMVAAYSNKDRSHVERIERLVRNYNIGGVMFMQGGPRRQAIMANRLQAAAKVPLLMAMDAEWGLDMRLDSSAHYAKQMTLGAMDDPKYVYQMGRDIARKMRALGVHVDFAPVLDVNSNPGNPVIGNRSFGENQNRVAALGLQYIKGLQDNKVLAVAKHFPGHGDTDTDSHVSLPVINTDLARLTEVDLVPFQQSFEAGVMGVIVAHLYMPLFDTTDAKTTTLSHALVTDLLKDKMGFKGLVFTDALNMKSVSKLYKDGELDALALAAGTWHPVADGVPMMDYSSQAPGERKGKHTDDLVDDRFSAFLDELHGLNFDIMLEIKNKEVSALRAVAQLRERGLSPAAPNLPSPPLKLPPDPNAPVKARRASKPAPTSANG